MISIVGELSFAELLDYCREVKYEITKKEYWEKWSTVTWNTRLSKPSFVHTLCEYGDIFVNNNISVW